MMFLLSLVSLLTCGALAVRAQSAYDSFDPRPNGAVRVVLVQPDGKILIGGSFTTLSPNGSSIVRRNHIARLNADGTLDMFFDPNANVDVEAIALDADGRILVGGQFTSIGRAARNRIARLDAITGLADAWNPDGSGRVYSIVVQPDGKILTGGVFQNIGGQKRNHLARLEAATGVADAFDPSPNGFNVYTIALQSDGKILVGGSFNSIGGAARNSIARLDPRTGQADSFDPGAIGVGKPFAVCYAIALQSDGRILVGGGFKRIGGQPRNRIARLDAETGEADPFDPDATGGDPYPDVSTIAVQRDGTIMVGGAFTEIGGEKRNHLARLDATTGAVDAFDPNPDALGIYALAVQADGRVLAGGSFNSINGQDHNYFARLTKDRASAAPDPSL